MAWHTNFMPLSKERGPGQNEKIVGNLDGTDSTELIHFFLTIAHALLLID